MILTRDETMKSQLLRIIRSNPGIQGTDEKIPKHLRRFLSVLEKQSGLIEYRDGWYLKGGNDADQEES